MIDNSKKPIRFTHIKIDDGSIKMIQDIASFINDDRNMEFLAHDSVEEIIKNKNEEIDKLQQKIIGLELQNQALVANDKYNNVTLKQYKELTEKYTHEVIEGQRKDATIKDLLTRNAELLKANNKLCKDNLRYKEERRRLNALYDFRIKSLITKEDK